MGHDLSSLGTKQDTIRPPTQVLTIQPKALARVFVFFCPGPAPPEVATVLNKPVATGLIWDATGAKRDATGVRIEFEVYVRCRLVKDFQKVPKPQLSGRSSARAEDAQAAPTQSHMSPSTFQYTKTNMAHMRQSRPRL